SNLHVSVLTFGEMLKGILRLSDAEKKQRLLAVYHHLKNTYGLQTHSIDTDIAEKWAEVVARFPKTLPCVDSFIGATALAKGFVLVTRNEKDFRNIGVEVLNPWKS